MVRFPILSCAITCFLLLLGLLSTASFRYQRIKISERCFMATFDDAILPSSNANSGTNLDTNPTTTPRTRRIRYTGKYPKAFGEKYKELSQNVTVMEHVIKKGATPAGSHVSIMVDEIIALIPTDMKFAEKKKKVKLEGIVNRKRNEMAATPPSTSTFVSVDCTLGFGGHSLAILNKLTQYYRPNYHHVMLDRDAIEMDKTKTRLLPHTNDETNSGTISFHHANFGDLGSVLTNLPSHVQAAGGGEQRIHFLLADLGVSSMQIDDPTRGFTYKAEGPLDMRLDTTTPGVMTALEYLHSVKRNTLKKALEENSDELLALPLATALLEHPIPTTTVALAERCHLKQGQEAPSKEELNKAVARVLQAIRIEVNAEFTSLDRLLTQLPSVMAEGGVAVFLTFHSGEDRRVKKHFKQGFADGIYVDWSREVGRAGNEERHNNPRSKCAKLRYAVRSALPVPPAIAKATAAVTTPVSSSPPSRSP